MCSALVPAALGGVAWSSRRTAATPGLLVIARADDVDGVAVTGIKDRADSSITQDDMPKCSQLLAPSHGENRGSSPLGSANKINCLYPNRPACLFPSPIFLQINSGTRGTGLLRVLVPPISYEE